MSNENPYGGMSGYASQFQSGSGMFNRNPVMQQQQMGVPGISTGNMFIDMFMGQMMGNRALPQPNASQSMMEAMTLRRRSLEGFNRMAPNSFANNAFAQNFGGFQGILPQAFNMAESMTGGPGNGIMSSLLNPGLGGNPIQAQQKLYAGSNGITRTAAFGLRGEMSLNQSNNMMKDMSKWFYKQDKNDDEVGKLVDSYALKAKNGDNLGLSAALKKAVSSGETKEAIEALAKTFGTSLDKATAEALSKRAKTTAFSGTNFSNTYGYKMEEITGSWIGLQHKGLIKGVGSERETFKEFGENGGMGMIRSAQNLFGSKDASGAVADMNDFIGVGSFNAANKTDRERFTHMAHSMEATSLASGISKADLLQLTESIREVSKQSGMGKAVGGMEAANMAMKAVGRATDIAAGQSQDFLRRNGGIAGYTAQLATQMAKDDAGLPASQLAGLYGFVGKTLTGDKQTKALEMIRNRETEMLNDPSKASISEDIAFKKKLGQLTGVSAVTLSNLSADTTNIANGKTAIDQYNKKNGTNFTFSSEVTGAARLNAFLGGFSGDSRKSMEQAIESSGNSEEQIRKYNELEVAAGRTTGLLDNQTGSGHALAELGNSMYGATAKGRAEAAASKKETDARAVLSAKMEKLWGGARNSLSGSIVQSLLSGDAAKGGFNALAANHINDLIGKASPEDKKKLEAIAQLTGKDREKASLGSILSTVGNTAAGGYLGDISLSDLKADLKKDTAAAGKIKAIKDRLKADMDGPDEEKKKQAEAIQASMFDSKGNVRSGAGGRIMNSIGVASQDLLLGDNEQYQEMLKATGADIYENIKGTGITSVQQARELGVEGVQKKIDDITGTDADSEDQRKRLGRVAADLKIQKDTADSITDKEEGSGKDIMNKLAESLGEGSPIIEALKLLTNAINEPK